MASWYQILRTRQNNIYSKNKYLLSRYNHDIPKDPELQENPHKKTIKVEDEESVSEEDKIRQKNREKKIQRESTVQETPLVSQNTASANYLELGNRKDSSRSEQCASMEEPIKFDQHDEVITKLDKGIIVEQELI
ncbi:hypothetical protein RhiirA4_471414 [Rhizophagus irregularis]|uniref:Uncharacterized protein n=1 Tax=Rhizophagus irregularis TaxID=588596 RepID=A0A2I1H336_9GLOM|nr:hypothetical protein RhiirA4_471414 [Rhizophagus irregularis]